MARTLIPSTLAFALLFAVAAADDGEPVRNKTYAKTPPVQLSARRLQSQQDRKEAVEISLAIGDEYEIYSEHEHELLTPLSVQLLDADRQPIKSKLSFPTAKRIPFDRELGGDYRVYAGKPKLTATYSVADKPIYVRLSYHGYSTHGY